MTPLAPFISHGVGLLVAYLVTRWQLGLTPDQQSSAASFISMIFEGIAIWIAIHLGISWKINPTNAVTPGAIKKGVDEKRARKVTKNIEERVRNAGAESSRTLEEPPSEVPPLGAIPAKERGDGL